MKGFAAFTPPPAHPAIVELASRPQWVAWALAERNGALTKPPISPRTGRGASHSQPADWGNFDQAVAFATSQGMAGIGFVTTDDDGVTGVDLDKCRDPESGAFDPWAQEIIDFGETYAEVSPSGRGIRMFWRGKIAETIKADAAHVEIYRSRRYLTVTGRHIEGTPTDIRHAPHTEAALRDRVRQVKWQNAPQRAVGSQLRQNEDGTVIDLETGECFDSLEEAERARTVPAVTPVQHTAPARPAGDDFFRTVNSRALAALPAWVPSIFPSARYHPGTGAYRVSSRDLGRDLEEDLSIAPNGIVDFGVADMGDARQGKRSAIDLAMEYGAGGDAAEAALWLCDRLGTDPASIGWQEATTFDADAAAIGAQAIAGMMKSEAGAAPSEKPKPDPFDLWSSFEPAALPVDVLPSVIEEFARVRGEMMGADPAGLAMAALTTCAALLTDRIRLRMKRHDDWMESPRLWCALIGAPSTMKSPVLRVAAGPLLAIDGEMVKENRKALAEYDELKTAGEKPTRPQTPRLKIEDITIEKAQERLAESPDGVLAIQDELSGWFGSMDRYSGAKGGQKDRGFWLQAYNGGLYDVARIGRGDLIIENLSVCLLGGIQPDLIRKIAGDTHDDGLLQRMIPIVLRPGGEGRDEPMPNIAAQYGSLARGLHRMQPPFLGSGSGNLASSGEGHLVFDDEGQEIFRAAQRRHRQLVNIEVVNAKLATAVGKYDGIFGRLAIVFHCIEHADKDRPPRAISGETVGCVDTFMRRFLFPHALAFYSDVIGIADDQELLVEVAGFLLAHPEINEVTFRTFARGSSKMRRCKDRKMVETLLDRLDAFAWLDRKPTERNQTSDRWTVNPRIHELFPDRAKLETDRRSLMKEAITAAYAEIEAGDDAAARRAKFSQATRRAHGREGK